MISVKRIFCISAIKQMFFYLGSNMFIGHKKTEHFDLFFNEKISNCLSTWQNKLLFYAGKTTLIHFVLSFMPMYVMASYKILFSICNNLNLTI